MEKYTSEMIRELLNMVISISTAADATHNMYGGKLSENAINSILYDLRKVRTEAMLIRNRMLGWDYAAFDVILMQEVKKKFEERIHQDEET